MRVLHVAMECLPFSKVGGMADVTGALPAVLEELAVESRVMTPYYPRIYKGPLGREIAAFDVWVGSAAHRVRLFETDPFGILVDQPTAFDRPGVYDDPASGQGFSDNLFRCLVLCQAARAAVRQGVFTADVVHCHDNHTAFVPVYLKDDGGPPSVFTIHNLAYQGICGAQDFWLTGLDPKRFHGHSAFEYFGDLNLMKAGISFADLVTTVSPSYAKEIVTPEQGHGLDGVLRHLGDRLLGILNGIDEATWDPSKDPLLPATYTAAKPAGKETCKEALRKRGELENDPQAPLVGLVSRFTHQKGIDLLGSNLPWLVRSGAQVIVLGNGDPGLMDLFRGAQGRWPGRVAALAGYDEALAHLVYAGSDIFCMPSRFEPCGLSQMYAMRYGAVPVATRMGGLKDTVLPFDEERKDGTGVLADWATADSLQGALDYALTLWKKPQLFRIVRRNGMQRDFSWKRSAEGYFEAYRRVART
ncbi:MAG TPA: glycogen synthase GlgA [Planctomycetota bacterium]|nr:glycogen synthase GlgA [Planctomycetota bacterium]